MCFCLDVCPLKTGDVMEEERDLCRWLCWVLGDVVTSAAMAAKKLYSLMSDGDGSGTKISCKTKDVNNDGGGYGYLLKNHFLIR